MLALQTVFALLASSPLVTAQLLSSRASLCPLAVPYTATAISRTFDYCIPAFAYGPSFSAASSPYPTAPTACANLCTGSCVAANWAGPNNCQLALGTLQFLSTFPTWNPTWTAYVVRTTPTLAPVPTPTPGILLPPVVATPLVQTPIPTPIAAPVTPSTVTTSSTSSVTSTTSPVVIPVPASPTPELANIVCPSGNGTNYTDPIGAQFSIYCGFDLYDAEPELRTVQTTFQNCIDDCNRRFAGRCPGVTWLSARQWCYVKPLTATLRASTPTLWSALKLPGPEGLTCPEANGTIYTDGMYTDQLRDQYQITCGVELVDSISTRRSAQISFQACINDCHEFSDCEGVTWRPNGEDQRWCYHKVRGAVVRRAGGNFWSAQRVFEDIGSASGTPRSPIVTSTFAVL